MKLAFLKRYRERMRKRNTSPSVGRDVLNKAKRIVIPKLDRATKARQGVF